jgi:hypothetical protein
MLLDKYLISQYNGSDFQGRRVYNFGGGGDSAPAPAPSQVSQVTIPEYAKPYVERLLGKAEAATGAPYQTYGGQRLSATDPQVLAARQGVAGLQQPGQFATGTGLAGAGGLNALGAGQTYMGMATSPGAQQAFMSPYMQNVVDVQKQEAIRDAQKGQLAQNLAAARQGTYGGARQLLAGTERERNLGNQLAQIQAAGSQRAFEQAQNAMQFGTTADIQGGQAATQAGATLGQLGIGQQQQDLERLRAQEAAGSATQQEKQAALDLAYQDFIRQQQNPYAQLGFMSDILRGSGNLAQTGSRALYEAPPSTGSQLLGLASTLGGAYLAGRKFAEGGEIKGLSGIKGYTDGGDVIADMVDVGKLTPEQIQGTQQSGARPDVPDYVLAGQLDAKIAEMKRLQADMEASDTTAVDDIRQEATQLAGLDSISIPDDYYRSEEETAQLAGGGIIAFANGGPIPINERYGGRQYPDGSVGFAGPLAFIGPALTAGRAALGRDPLIAGGRAIATGAKNLGKGLFTRAPVTAGLGTAGGLYGAYDYVTSEGEPGSSEAAAFADRQDKEAGAALAQETKNKKVEVSDKTVKKVTKAEDAYEKALKKELDKTDMSDDDKMQAIGFAMIKAGAKTMQGKSQYALQNIGEGIEAGADDYVKTLQQAKKDKRELTKTLAEYGLAKEKLAVMREDVAAKREGTAETAATRKEIAMQNILAKANAEYNDLVSKNPLMGQRFLDKENKKINPQFKSRADYIREQMAINPSNLMAGAPPSSIATPQARAADFYNPRG